MPLRIEDIIPDLRNPTARIRIEAAQLLGASGDPRAIDALMEALQDTDMEVVIAAVDALSQMGPDATSAALEALEHPQSDVRYAATMILANIGEGIDALIVALDDLNEDVQEGAADALEEIGTSDALAAVMEWRRQNPRD